MHIRIIVMRQKNIYIYSTQCYRQTVSFLRGHIDEIGCKWGPQCLLQNKGQLTRNMSSDGTAYTSARV